MVGEGACPGGRKQRRGPVLIDSFALSRMVGEEVGLSSWLHKGQRPFLTDTSALLQMVGEERRTCLILGGEQEGLCSG
jgi:hypothetical protein